MLGLMFLEMQKKFIYVQVLLYREQKMYFSKMYNSAIGNRKIHEIDIQNQPIFMKFETLMV